MKKKLQPILLLLVCCILSSNLSAQQKGTGKVVKKAEQISQKTREISEASDHVSAQAKSAAENIGNVAKNVKVIVKIFEPILQHFKKEGKNKDINVPSTNTATSQNTDNNNSNEIPPAPLPSTTGENNGNTERQNTGDASFPPSPYGTPESEDYNPDGTMNCGHQNSGKYGNCINLLEAKVVGMGEAEESPEKIDLIFFAQYDGLGYSFESPHDAPIINEGVNVKKWHERNETEIAQSKLTIAQFEKIKSNPELLNAVKNTVGFGANFYTSNKMDGRVFAVKLIQDDRQFFALLAVYNQFGTAGSKGYLKIKIKVQGVDRNGDGSPDPNAYIR